MIVECRDYEALVDAKVLYSYDHFVPAEEGLDEKYSFLKCPKCDCPLLVARENYGGGIWSEPYRLYPPRDKTVNPSLPKPIRNTYQEALSCFEGKNFTASAIMCRKTLEGICNALDIKVRNLKSGLEELKDKGIIENRLFEWANALRISGNEAVHDVNVTVSGQNAKDIIEFTEALLEYIFTFRDKFDKFLKRQKRI